MTRRTWWALALAIAILALGASWSSLGNGFAYDDQFVVVNDALRMHTLTGWWREFASTYWLSEGRQPGDGYRPLTILAFKLQWVLGNGTPLVFHAVSVALHTVTAVLVFWLACGALPLAAATVAAAFYAVHPVHVEAVANVVGQSELVVALLVVLAMGLYLHGRARGPLGWPRWSAIGALYAVGLLFKEHAITLIALLPLAELLLVRDRESALARVGRMRLPLLSLALVAMVYLWVRSVVVVGSGFAPYIVFEGLNLSTRDRILTMIGVSPEWLRLFLWPARLMTEYTPPYLEVAQGPSLTQLPGLVVLLGMLGLIVATWRRSPATAFGIAWVVITLSPSSNFLLPAGFIIAERTLLLPSVGAMIAVGSAVPWLYERLEHRPVAVRIGMAVTLLLVGLGLARSHTRNQAWKDNGTLFRQAIVDSPDSYRAHFMYGTYLFERGNRIEAERHYRIALQLFPYDPLMSHALAEQYRGAGMCAPAVPLYEFFFQLAPTASRGRLGYAQCLLLTLRLEEAREAALSGIRLGANVKLARGLIAATKVAADSLEARRLRGDTTLKAIPAKASSP
jgi:tetratricopeptide (TPR) repeat protein